MRIEVGIAAVVLVSAGIWHAARSCLADDRTDHAQARSGGWSVTAAGRSSHGGPHSNAIPRKWSEVSVSGVAPDGEQGYYMSGGRRVYWLSKKLRACHMTLFCGNIKAEAGANKFDESGNAVGWALYAYKEVEWEPAEIEACTATLTCSNGDISATNSESKSAHMWAAEPDLGVPTMMSGGAVGVLAPDIVTDLKDPGVFLVSRDDATGEFSVDCDGSGNPIVLVPMSIVMRLTSRATHIGAGAVKYTYILENLSTEARSFRFDQITLPQMPSGWSGIVASGAVESIEFTATGDDLVCIERAQGEFSVMDGGDTGRNSAEPVRVYTCASRHDYRGSVSISAASSSTASGGREVVASWIGDTPDIVVLFRRHSDGGYRPVAQATGTLAAASAVYLVDPDPPAGVGVYRVGAGTAVNGSMSAAFATGE